MNIRRTLILTIVFPLVLLTTLAGVFLWQIHNLLSLSRRVEHADALIARANAVEKLLIDRETGLRGYLLTGKAEFLQPYHAAENALPSSLDRLVGGVKDNPVQVRRLAELRTEMERWSRFVRTLLALRERGGDYRALVAKGEGKRRMDRMREQLARFRETEEKQRDQRTDAARAAGEAVVWVGGGSSLLIGLLLAFLGYRLLSQVSRTYEAALAEAREGREWLRVTLASIGDGVITTDRQGTVTFLNPVAQALTGWKAEDAAGKPLEEVFPIANEVTREKVLNPVAKVLREGQVVGLANHTVLLPKDGPVIVIEDSAAPIKSESGEIQGVVLVFHNATERREAEREIERLNERLARRVEELAEAAQRKDEFLAMLAHELRNPLGAVSNALQVMRRSDPDTPAYERAQEAAIRQLLHQTRLVDDLLDVARITRNAISLRQDRLDLARLVRDTAEDYRGRVEGAGLSLTVELPREPVPVMGDPTRLAQVLSNLLDNAAKYTSAGGAVTVQVACEPAGRLAAVTVRDTGVGISPDLLPCIFDPFAQADRSLDRTRGGLGLGLALVRGLVQLHGGTILVESAGTGRGAEFTFRLPLAGEPAMFSHSSAPRGLAAGPLRVLIVEDHRDAAETLRDLLEVFGYKVELAYTGPDGVDAALHFHPQVVLCDIGLPGMDGFQVAQKLRQHPATARMHLIAVTGYGGEEDRRRSSEVGFEKHLTKPVDPEELQQALTSVVEQ